MTRNARSLALIAACGAAAGLTSAASAQTVINISGATLFESFFVSPASTNDYIDVDGDGFAIKLSTGIDQLDPNVHPPTGQALGASLPWWAVHYRETGSVAGLQELINFGSTFVTTGATGQIPVITSSKSFLHGTNQFVANGVGQGIWNSANPGGSPIRSDMITLQATYTSPGVASPGGTRADIAPLDVPTTWAVLTAGTGAPAGTPGLVGYGNNPRRSVNQQGTSAGSNFTNTLANLGPRNLYNGIPGSSNADTIFDSPVAAVPIAIMTNLGTGVSQLKQSEARHLFATGRLVNGENLVAVTRESGSGTRNGCMNSLGLDPSWGIGDNVGGTDGVGGSVLVNEHRLGPDFVPCNKVGSGDMESTVLNHRLAIGYSGAERAASGPAWLSSGGKAEIVGIQADLSGGNASYARPTLNNLIHNNPAAGGYVVGGVEQLATLGDPRRAPIAKGGDPANINTPMVNVEAAAYINNITRSIEDFSNPVQGCGQTFSPAELLATKFILVGAVDYVQSTTNPTVMIPNPGFVNSLQNCIGTANTVFTNASYTAFNSSLNGLTPTRKTGVVYSDGVAGGANYINQGGANVGYAVANTMRNRIAGDFNGDGLRNLNDATDMLRAWRQRNGGPTWTAPAGTGPIAGAPGSDAVIEILGDFNGDGNFSAADVRYWADGLAVDPATSKVDRKKGFKAIDDAWFALTGNNNFFGTTIAGGRPYNNGNSAADVAGSGGAAPGWAPVGADGIIDAADVTYIQAQFIGNPAITDGHANWDNLSEAVAFDVSGDLTGDLIVDQADVTAITTILGTSCYPNCDGSTTPPVLNVLDFSCFLNRFAAGDTFANCDASTTPPVLNVLDFSCFLNQFAAGCP